MSRPSTLPRWADTGSAQVAEPNSAKKDVGWTESEKPANFVFNWILKFIYLWISYFDERTLKPKDSSDTPLFLYQDKDGNNRRIVDHNGFLLGGKITRFEETWAACPSATGAVTAYSRNPNWYHTQVGAATVIGNGPFAGFQNMGNCIALQPGTSNNDGTCLITGFDSNDGSSTAHHFVFTDDMSVALEFEMCMSVGTDHLQARVGIFDSIGLNLASTTGIWIQRDPGAGLFYNAQWQHNGSGTFANSAAASDSNSVFSFRIELHGANTPLGHHARYFCNGVLFATDNGLNVPPAGTALGVGIMVKANAASNNSSIAVSNITMEFNRALTPAAL